VVRRNDFSLLFGVRNDDSIRVETGEARRSQTQCPRTPAEKGRRKMRI